MASATSSLLDRYLERKLPGYRAGSLSTESTLRRSRVSLWVYSSQRNSSVGLTLT